MKFCTKCGKQLNDDAKFCDTCGAPVSGSQIPPIPGTNENVGDDTKRKVTYVGVEKRCPWCNARIPDSFAITCPECNRELSGRKVESSVKDFFNRLSDLSGGYESSDDRDKKEYFGMKNIFVCVSSRNVYFWNYPRRITYGFWKSSFSRRFHFNFYWYNYTPAVITGRKKETKLN